MYGNGLGAGGYVAYGGGYGAGGYGAGGYGACCPPVNPCAYPGGYGGWGVGVGIVAIAILILIALGVIF